MKAKTVVVLWGITVGLGLLATGAFAANPPARCKDWKLIWRDEFNGRKLDPQKWSVLLREHSKHNELQYYVPDEVYLENGWLRLRSRERNYGAQRYTSGRLDTAGKFAPTYGRFEIRARLPGGQGLWPPPPSSRNTTTLTTCACLNGDRISNPEPAASDGGSLPSRGRIK